VFVAPEADELEVELSSMFGRWWVRATWLNACGVQELGLRLLCAAAWDVVVNVVVVVVAMESSWFTQGSVFCLVCR